MSDAGDDIEPKVYSLVYTNAPRPEDGDDQAPANEAQTHVSRDGRAKATFANEDIYEGNYEKKKRNGHGKYTWTKLGAAYDGEYEDGMRCGQGKMTYPDGSEYNGHWSAGQRHGFGTYYFSDGNRYSGNWQSGKRHGDGAFFFGADASQLDGAWQHGKFVKGHWKLCDGTKYFGKFTCKENPKGEDEEEEEENEDNAKPDLDLTRIQPIGSGVFVFPSGNQQDGVYTKDGVWHGGKVGVTAAV